MRAGAASRLSGAAAMAYAARPRGTRPVPHFAIRRLPLSQEDRPDRFDRDRGDRERGDRDRGGDRGDRGDRDRGERYGSDRFERHERGPMSVKARLRAKARKRDRKMRKRSFGRKKVSRLTTDKGAVVDYKDPKLLRSFLSETGKILPRRITGNTAKQQREVTLAIKRARHLALLPYPPNMA